MSTQELQISAVNSAEIAMLIKSNAEMKDVVMELSANISELVKAQIRTEERQQADREIQRRNEKRMDAQDSQIKRLEQDLSVANKSANDANTQALQNARWINAAVAFLTAIVLYIAKISVDKFTGG